MERISSEKFLFLILCCDRVDDKGKTKSDNKTRQGHYVSILSGLSSSSWFVGRDLIANEFIIERVD
jgi:hypothetical protein